MRRAAPRRPSTSTAASAIERDQAAAISGHAPAYRPDIDGLRALAVVPVVLYHLGSGLMPGGFVGVDVFFVISGYLITRLLAREIDRGRYSILGFYDRRVRRIFPALFAVLLFCAAMALLLLFPVEIEQFAPSLLSAVLFYSNMHFWATQDYFNNLESDPLLHTWSLAVEEQFYILFPLLLWAMRAWRKTAIRATVIGLGAVSLGAAELLVRTGQENTAFYWAPLRAWELLLGSFIALEALPLPDRRWAAELAAAAGVLLILASCRFFHAHMHFPGAVALAPCLGAGLVIAAGRRHSTWTGRALSCRPAVFVGLVSYSLYLWHWPIIVYAHLYLIRPFSPAQMAALFAAALVMAALSWRFVEQPIRRRQVLATAPGLWRAAGLGMAGFAGLALALGGTARLLPWADPRTTALSDHLRYQDRQAYRRGQCFVDSHALADQRFDDAACLSTEPGKRSLLLMGDSHAAHLWSGLARTRPDLHVLQATATGCKPVLGTIGEGSCKALMARIFTTEIPARHPDAVMLSARWIPADIPNLLATVDRLSETVGTVYVVGPMPEYEAALPRLLALAEARHDPGLPAEALAPDAAELDARLQAALAGHPAVYISPVAILCGGGPGCRTADETGTPLQWDYGHLTEAGSAYLAARMTALR